MFLKDVHDKTLRFCKCKDEIEYTRAVGIGMHCVLQRTASEEGQQLSTNLKALFILDFCMMVK